MKVEIFQHVASIGQRKSLKAWIHGVTLRAMAKLHRVSTPEIVARNIVAVEFRPTSATLHTILRSMLHCVSGPLVTDLFEKRK